MEHQIRRSKPNINIPNRSSNQNSLTIFSKENYMSLDDLIKGLNDDLAAEWGTVIRYTYQAAKSFGVLGIELREMLEEEVQMSLVMQPF